MQAQTKSHTLSSSHSNPKSNCMIALCLCVPALRLFSAFLLLGILNIWDLRTGRFPIFRFEHDARIQALALSQEKPIVATASAFDVVMLYPNEEGHWHVASEFEVQKLVSAYCAY